ncbi:uncharacterized protein LOC142588472 isoform X1 [Dermacentor variabilis]|uniref:uncharacterized protein LOC142588472 isoform X1 n=2 Tax=Dermacentor variabilis TaxID=34621 RepID=UPI003F5BEB81
MVKFFAKFHLPSFRSLGMDHRSDSKWVLTSKDGTVHPLPAGMIFIGRQECDIIVDSASVDKRHAVIFFNPSDKCFHVKDLNSVTGTYLNGVRIPEQSYVKLNHLDSLRFGYGHEVFSVHKTTDRAVPSDSVSPKRTAPAFGDGDLVIREDSSANKTFSRDSPASDSSDKMQRSGNMTKNTTFLCESLSRDAPSQLGSSSRSAEDVIPHRMKLSPPSSSAESEAKPLSSPGLAQRTSPPLTSTPKEPSPPTSSPRSMVATPPMSSPHTPAASATPSPSVSDPASPQKASSSSPSSAEKEASLSSPVMQDADSLEDLSRTEDSLSTVREVLPGRPPPTKPTTLSWKPLHSLGKPRAPPPPKERPEEKGGDSSPGDCGAKSTPSKDEHSPCLDTPASQTQASGSTSMAFTIHFDNDTTGGKPLALKDSIRKFAPPKPESERTPSKSRASPVSKPSEPLVSTGGSGRRTPTSPNNATDLAKRRWSGAEGRGRSSGGGWSSDVESSRQARRQDDQRLSDSASYLIQRMLNDGPARVPLPGPVGGVSSSAPRVEPSSGPEQVVSPADDRSETGTYTVETDRVDPDVEEARRRIDEVFGVSSQSHPSTLEQYQRVRPEGEGASGSRPRSQGNVQSLCFKFGGGGGGVSGLACGSIDLGRPKRRLPTPPSERAPLDVFVPSTESSSGANTVRKSASAAVPVSTPCANATARKRLGSAGSRPSPPCSPPRTHRTTFTKTPSNKVMSTSFGDGSFLRQTPAASSSTQRRSAPTQRKSWGLTGSEADLAASGDTACGSEETASVVSDTSTEPSSHSSGSRGGPQMKLNRAFALRRARLGLPEVGGLPPATAAPSRGKTPHHGSNPNLSRQDGGRFSLRLPRGVRATDVGVTRAELLRGKAHQRNDSDPTAAYRLQQHSVSDGESRHHSPRIQRKQPAGTSYISDGDDDARTGSPVQFGRSASFGGHRDLALTPAAPDRQQRGRSGGMPTTGSSLSRGETFLKGGAGASGSTFVRSGRKPERQSGDGESKTPTENGVKTPSTTPGRRELTALDSLVISAIHQLSGKLRTSARTLIEKERLKYPENSDVRLMLEEVLPRVVERRPSDSPTDGNLTRELSSILKNLKRIEQSLEVLNSLAPCEGGSSSAVAQETTTKTAPTTQKPRGGFFYVDV